MYKHWTVELDGRQHEIEAEWDVFVSGAGRIVVDNEEVDKWGIGMIFPGIRRSFSVGGRAADLVQGLFSFSIDIPGVTTAIAQDQEKPPSRGTSPLVLIILVVLILAVLAIVFRSI